MSEDIHFKIKHGKNTSDRIGSEVIKAVIETLVKNGIEIGEEKFKVKPFSDAGFDVVNVKGFNLIEFKITKTGWEQ